MEEITSSFRSHFCKLKNGDGRQLTRNIFSTIEGKEEKNINCTSDGFTITLLPAAKAGAIFFIAINSGWLKGYFMEVHPLDPSQGRRKNNRTVI